MAAGDVYRKTALGVAEIQERRLKLSPRLRTMLILVDGAQTEEMLETGAAGVGAPPDFLAQLVAAGLIERSDGRAAQSPPGGPQASGDDPGPPDAFSRFRDAKAFMNATIVEALGDNSLMFAMKLERANRIDELADLIDAFRTALSGARGDDYGRAMAARLKDLLR